MSDPIKLCLLVAATLAGTLFSLWTSNVLKGWISGFILLGIAILVATNSDHPLRFNSPLVVWIALAGGLAFGLSFPCCVQGERVGPMAMIGIGIVALHCLLDGHVVREATTAPLIGMFCVHKFLDGADVRILSLSSKRSTLIARVLLALATPVGFLAIPASATAPVFHLSLFACVIGFNVGTAFHVFRHELHVRAEAHAA